MSYRFYIATVNGNKYLQLWKDKERCVSMGTAQGLVTTLTNENKTKKLMDKVTKITKG